MAKAYPDQKPAFLFDEIERSIHSSITVETWQALQAERDSLKARVEKAEAWWEVNGKQLKAERDSLRSQLEALNAQTKPSHLLAMAVLLELASEVRTSKRNQTGIVSEILDRYPGKRGLSKRNLEEIFAAANSARADAEGE
ncbi:hypothetical protein [Pseudomonas oryzihabitans]|uniref:SMC interacting uncharacterized protein involved in chromosome segregation n=1 Tax=Pseudomonas oryzihabitans TaxID=47885 RepID=A0AAJ2EZ61_9PSED|nr:hypothetical protein [Pseudomonas psychrotolerans]MDR6234015.1 SMC interacting uncharacterized protein involved in chromosome segregation [Pseudomonas psychrotolerans]